MMLYNVIDTVVLYEEMLNMLNLEKKKNFFRYTMMAPFKKIWQLINVPLKAEQKNGYDVMLATRMLGWLTLMMMYIFKLLCQFLRRITSFKLRKMRLKHASNILQMLT